MKKKITKKDQKDWYNFINSKSYVENKDSQNESSINTDLKKTIDLHGYTLEEANIKITELIRFCYEKRISKIKVITGKGLRSKNLDDPYVSKDLSILKNSIPFFIKSNSELMKKIKNINENTDKKGNSGYLEIILKKL